MVKKTYMDFAIADYNNMKALSTFDNCYEGAIISAQQCVEKLLKHIISKESGTVNKTHNLKNLLLDVSKYDTSLRIYKNYASTLGNYYFELRYPQEHQYYCDINKEDMLEAVNFVEEIRPKLLKIIEKLEDNDSTNPIRDLNTF